MSASRKRFLSLAAIAALAAACVTINVYFPEKAVKSLSEAIEREVNKGAATPPASETPPAEGAPEGTPAEGSSGGTSPAGFTGSLLGITPVLADEVADPDVSNPAIRKIIDSRRARVGDVRKWKSLGVLGENNQALLEVKTLEPVKDLKDRAAVQRLVKEENADREQLFQEIALAKSVDSSQIPKIRETYAQTLRDTASQGDWIQMPDGTWTRK